jgi:hypothetical protein
LANNDGAGADDQDFVDVSSLGHSSLNESRGTVHAEKNWTGGKRLSPRLTSVPCESCRKSFSSCPAYLRVLCVFCGVG